MTTLAEAEDCSAAIEGFDSTLRSFPLCAGPVGELAEGLPEAILKPRDNSDGASFKLTAPNKTRVGLSMSEYDGAWHIDSVVWGQVGVVSAGGAGSDGCI